MAIRERSSALSFKKVSDLMYTVYNAEKLHLLTRCKETSTKHARLHRSEELNCMNS